MSSPTAIDLFNKLNARVDGLLKLGQERQGAKDVEGAESIFRACIVLLVSALDAYIHQKAFEVFDVRITQGPKPNIDKYLKVGNTPLTPPTASSLIRYRLSFKTLVSPDAIDECIGASGTDSAEVWRKIGIDRGSRESRLRNSLSIAYDRRNSISHEGDWDPVQLDLRHISDTHVLDCQACVREVAEGIERHWN